MSTTAERVERLEKLVESLTESVVAMVAVKREEVAQKTVVQRMARHRADLDSMIRDGEYSLFNGGPRKYLVDMPQDGRMRRVVGATDPLHARSRFESHFGIAAYLEPTSQPVIVELADEDAAYAEYCRICESWRIQPVPRGTTIAQS